MEPELPVGHSRTTLVDLLDRVLDKGIVLRADLVISVAGIPLVGARLSVALAGMETMLKHGIMSGWDQVIRAAATQGHALHAAGTPPLKECPNEAFAAPAAA